MRNYITLPPLNDKAIMIAPISPASQSWKDVDTIGYVDPGSRWMMNDDGSYVPIMKYDPGIRFQGLYQRYYCLPWILASCYEAEVFAIDAHNEPELLYCDEFIPSCKDWLQKTRSGGTKVFFTLETQSFHKLPPRYVKAFGLIEKIIVPYEREFFTKCVDYEAFEPYDSKFEFVGNIVNPNTVTMLKNSKENARSNLGLSQDKTIVFCTYGRGEGAAEIVSSISQIGSELHTQFPNLLFIISDPTGDFEKMNPKKSWMQFIGLDYVKAMTSLAACDYTVQGLGTSTLIETLVAGKPMVAVSLDRPYEEQASKGRGVQAFELGVHIPLQDFNTERLKHSLLHVMKQEPTRHQRSNLQKVLGDLKGSERVCDLLTKYLTVS